MIHRWLLIVSLASSVGCDEGPSARADGGGDGRTDGLALPDATGKTDGSDGGAGVSQDSGPPDHGAADDASPSGKSPGCGKAGAKTGAFADSVQAAGKNRTYFVSVPAGYDPATPHRLIFGYHGVGFAGKPMRDYLDLEGVAPTGPEIFVYPDGLGGDFAEQGQEGDDDLALFDAIRDKLLDSYCVDPERVFVTGQSGGGNHTTFLVCRRGDKIAAAVPVATGGAYWYLKPASCVGQVPVMVIHGIKDTIIEYDPWGLEARDFYLEIGGCAATSKPVEPSPCVRYDGCAVQTRWCAHDELTPWNDGHQIPSWYQQATVGFFRSF